MKVGKKVSRKQIAIERMEAERCRRSKMFARQIRAADCALEAYSLFAKTSKEKDLVFGLFLALLHREFRRDQNPTRIAERALKRFRAERDRLRFQKSVECLAVKSIAKFDNSHNGKVVIQL